MCICFSALCVCPMTVFIVFFHASSPSQFAMTCKCASHNYGTNLCRGFSFCAIRHINAGSFWNFQYSCTFVNSKWSASRFISFFVFFFKSLCAMSASYEGQLLCPGKLKLSWDKIGSITLPNHSSYTGVRAEVYQERHRV